MGTKRKVADAPPSPQRAGKKASAGGAGGASGAAPSNKARSACLP